MRWYCFHVAHEQSSVVAENLLMFAREPVTLALMSPEVQVYRRRTELGETFYFSPAAYLFFKPFVATYDGAPCERPVPTHDEPELRRMSLKSQPMWQPILPGDMPREDSDFPH